MPDSLPSGFPLLQWHNLTFLLFLLSSLPLSLLFSSTTVKRTDQGCHIPLTRHNPQTSSCLVPCRFLLRGYLFTSQLHPHRAFLLRFRERRNMDLTEAQEWPFIFYLYWSFCIFCFFLSFIFRPCGLYQTAWHIFPSFFFYFWCSHRKRKLKVGTMSVCRLLRDVSQTRFVGDTACPGFSISIVSHTRGLSNLLIFQGDVSNSTVDLEV